MEYNETMKAGRPRVVVVGAGMAGLSAAHRLMSVKNAEFELTVLEGSDRLGGRIWTSEFGGERVELGATWIHGIEGNPLYEIAKQWGALQGDSLAWECMDGFPGRPIIKAEGGVAVDEAIVEPVVRFYKKLMVEAHELLEEADCGGAFSKAETLGSFLKMRLNEFLVSEQQMMKLPASKNGLSVAAHENSNGFSANIGSETVAAPSPIPGFSWSQRSLMEGVFSIQQNLERHETAADSLDDLDLSSYGEYCYFPGKQITIPRGFSSIVHSLSNLLPSGSIQFRKLVERIHWSNSSSSRTRTRRCPPVRLHCRDGTTIEADHVIVTVSLGVLKAGIQPCHRLHPHSIQNAGNAQSLKATSNSNTDVERSNFFQPPLPSWKLDAINRLGFGIVDKVFTLMDCHDQYGSSSHSHMQFIYSSSFEGQSSDIPSWMRKTCSVYPIHSKSHILLAWLAGKEALEMESLPDEQISNAIVNTLSEFGYCQPRPPNFHGSAEEAGGEPKVNIEGKTAPASPSIIKHTRWGSDPLFLGSYSYIAAGSSGIDIDILAEPLPTITPAAHLKINASTDDHLPHLQILFAGEATHRYHYATTHGAYFSGLREADRLIRYYGFLS